MNHVTPARKKPVNLSLNVELVREARLLTPNLSETVETLLAAYVAEQRQNQAELDRGIAAAIAWHNELYEKDGLPGADFSPL